jgi:hypothetical protein
MEDWVAAYWYGHLSLRLRRMLMKRVSSPFDAGSSRPNRTVASGAAYQDLDPATFGAT